MSQPDASETLPARPEWSTNLAVFDLETTGIDVETARIVTAFVGVLDAAGITQKSWSWLADPGIEIPAQAAAVHGVTTERARAEGMPAAQVVAEILDRLREVSEQGLPLVIYNAPYDLSVLDREARRHALNPLPVPSAVIDPLVIDKAVDTYRCGKRTLTATAEVYGVPLTDAHDAGADAVAAGRVAQAIASAHAEKLDMPLAELHTSQVQWALEQARSFEEWMQKNKDPHFTTSGAWPQR